MHVIWKASDRVVWADEIITNLLERCNDPENKSHPFIVFGKMFKYLYNIKNN